MKDSQPLPMMFLAGMSSFRFKMSIARFKMLIKSECLYPPGVQFITKPLRHVSGEFNPFLKLKEFNFKKDVRFFVFVLSNFIQPSTQQ